MLSVDIKYSSNIFSGGIFSDMIVIRLWLLREMFLNIHRWRRKNRFNQFCLVKDFYIFFIYFFYLHHKRQQDKRTTAIISRFSNQTLMSCNSWARVSDGSALIICWSVGHALSSVVRGVIISHFPVIARVAMVSAFLTVYSNCKKLLKKYRAVELTFVTQYSQMCTNSIDINSEYIYIFWERLSHTELCVMSLFFYVCVFVV